MHLQRDHGEVDVQALMLPNATVVTPVTLDLGAALPPLPGRVPSIAVQLVQARLTLLNLHRPDFHRTSRIESCTLVGLAKFSLTVEAVVYRGAMWHQEGYNVTVWRRNNSALFKVTLNLHFQNADGSLERTLRLGCASYPQRDDTVCVGTLPRGGRNHNIRESSNYECQRTSADYQRVKVEDVIRGSCRPVTPGTWQPEPGAIPNIIATVQVTVEAAWASHRVTRAGPVAGAWGLLEPALAQGRQEAQERIAPLVARLRTVRAWALAIAKVLGLPTESLQDLANDIRYFDHPHAFPTALQDAAMRFQSLVAPAGLDQLTCFLTPPGFSMKNSANGLRQEAFTRYLSHLRVDRSVLLGQGSFGNVYLGILNSTDEVGSHEVAVKLVNLHGLSPADKLLAVDEVKNLGRVSGPHVVPLKGWALNANELFIITEHCPGGDWSTHIHEGEGAEAHVSVKLQWLLQLARGIATMHHRHGIVHRDIKPSNCFLDSEGNIKVGDVGCAKSFLKTLLTRYTTRLANVSAPLPRNPQWITTPGDMCVGSLARSTSNDGRRGRPRGGTRSNPRTWWYQRGENFDRFDPLIPPPLKKLILLSPLPFDDQFIVCISVVWARAVLLDQRHLQSLSVCAMPAELRYYDDHGDYVAATVNGATGLRKHLYHTYCLNDPTMISSSVTGGKVQRNQLEVQESMLSLSDALQTFQDLHLGNQKTKKLWTVVGWGFAVNFLVDWCLLYSYRRQGVF
eukprot:g17229.t1